MVSDPVGVVVVGIYGAGKSSVVEEMAGMLEEAQLSYAALDLDYFWWFAADGIDDAVYKEMLWRNLSAVVGNYRSVGVERFLMAWAVRDAEDLSTLRETLSMTVHTVRLTVPPAVIRTRLASSPTTERQRDLRNAERWLADGTGTGISDLEIDNVRPIRQVATEIMHWLGWR